MCSVPFFPTDRSIDSTATLNAASKENDMATTPNRSTTTRKTTATKRSTAAKKAAQTRSANQAATARKRTTAAKKAAETRRELERTRFDRVQETAERVVLVPLGATLVARDSLTEAFDGLRTSLGSRQKAEKELQLRRKRIEAELKRFERRGATARNRFEREVKSVRTDVTKQVATARKDVSTQGELVAARAQNILQTGLTRGQQAATAVQERVAQLV
jgi:hypothetical protein